MPSNETFGIDTNGIASIWKAIPELAEARICIPIRRAIDSKSWEGEMAVVAAWYRCFKGRFEEGQGNAYADVTSHNFGFKQRDLMRTTVALRQQQRNVKTAALIKQHPTDFQPLLTQTSLKS